MDDYRPHVWKTTDFGKTWTKITDGLDSGTHCHAVREDPAKKGVLYLATEDGVMFSPDAGKTWKSLQLNLPTVPVHDLQVKGDDLVLGTHGRAIWILDDLTVVREWADSLKEKPLHLFTVRPVTKWQTGGGNVSSHLRNSTTANPPRRGGLAAPRQGAEGRREAGGVRREGQASIEGEGQAGAARTTRRTTRIRGRRRRRSGPSR